MGEVEEEPEEDQGDAEHKDPEYEVKRQEPLAPLPQEITLLRRSLSVADLVTHVAQRLQLRGLAAIKSHRSRQGTNPVDQAARKVQPQQLEGDGVEEDDDEDRDENILPEEYSQ